MISNVKEEIKKIYARVLPSKDINQVFEQFKGREVDLYKALCRKYHLEEQYTKILSKSKKDMHEKEKEREKEDRMHEIQQAEAGKAAPSRPGETAAVPAAEVAAADDAEVAAADDAPADAAADDAPADATSDATAADRATADATATPAAVVRPKSPEMPPKAKVIRAWNPQRGTYGVPKLMRTSAKMSRPTPPPPPPKPAVPKPWWPPVPPAPVRRVPSKPAEAIPPKQKQIPAAKVLVPKARLKTCTNLSCMNRLQVVLRLAGLGSHTRTTFLYLQIFKWPLHSCMRRHQQKQQEQKQKELSTCPRPC